MQNNMQVLHVLAPLAELVGYATDFRVITSGTGTFTMELDHYSVLSEAEEKKVREKHMIFY